jgi:NAD(P)-dependent dehydrogenase (short-subunit alcohol dehydrogenase family)
MTSPAQNSGGRAVLIDLRVAQYNGDRGIPAYSQSLVRQLCHDHPGNRHFCLWDDQLPRPACGAEFEALGSWVLEQDLDRGQQGRIDVLFNNAGIPGAQTPLVDYPQDVFERVLQVNLIGTFLGMKHVLPTMIAQGRGAIVNMASVSGTVGAPTMAAYSASKHAVIGLTRTAAGEVGRQGIRVNAVCPGPIDTALIDTLHAGINPQDPAAVKAFNVGRNPMGRYGAPEEVARLVVFLASDAASYVNGAAWLIDGGRTAI